MWLVQLYKANDNTPQIVYSTSSCDVSELENYINPNDYIHELSLCSNWDFVEKKKLLILGKGQGHTLSSPKNERLIHYYYYIANITEDSIRHSDFIIFEYLTGSEFLMDFYINTKIYVGASLPPDITISGLYDLIEYIKNKTLSISFGSSVTPKYTIHFYDDCKYYKYSNWTVIIIKKPFLFMFYYDETWRYISLAIYATPKLIDDLNNHNSTDSSYSLDTDPPLNIDNIVLDYFNVSAMSGIQHSDISIYDDTNSLGYNLLRAFVGPRTYTDTCTINIGDIIFTGYIYSYSYDSLDEAAIYTYFPLLRPKLDADGSFNPYPQYDPIDEDSNIVYLFNSIILSNSSSINSFYLASYFNNYYMFCEIYSSGQLTSWRTGYCDFTAPFRFLRDADCHELATDTWGTESAINNANYLFMISKSPSSSTYSIKGVGCNETTYPLDFNDAFIWYFWFLISFFSDLSSINFSGFGYAFDRISQTLSSEVRLADSETCFVLFSDKLLDNEDDFINIYTATKESLPNSIICYFGDDSMIPHNLKNKVIYSDAIVTDLDINEQMSLVIKYIRYAQRLYKMFNG